MIEGPKFSGFDFSPVTLHATVTGIEQGVGGEVDQSVWSASAPTSIDGGERGRGYYMINGHRISILLSKYLEALAERYPGHWSNKRVLELGAGQGIVSLSAAALGAERVIITDVDSAVPDLEACVRLNGFSKPQVHVTPLDWTDREGALNHIWNDLLALPPASQTEAQSVEADILKSSTQQQQQQQQRPLDYILASDVIWVDYLIPALVETIGDLLQVHRERRDSVFDEKVDKEDASQQQQQDNIFVDGMATETRTKSPVLLLAYQFRSTRSDRLLFDSLDRLGLNSRKLRLDAMRAGDEEENRTGEEEGDKDSVYLDSKFRRPNLAIWKIWKS
ncbi:hypothetical protein EDD11_009790 [Mortierella claussenii]|nr:hypothetical protein EDD11_009790 [Mortierella claussenii]